MKSNVASDKISPTTAEILKGKKHCLYYIHAIVNFFLLQEHNLFYSMKFPCLYFYLHLVKLNVKPFSWEETCEPPCNFYTWNCQSSTSFKMSNQNEENHKIYSVDCTFTDLLLPWYTNCLWHQTCVTVTIQNVSQSSPAGVMGLLDCKKNNSAEKITPNCKKKKKE